MTDRIEHRNLENRIILVRHGETAGNSSVRLYGSTDVPLSDTGRAQLALTGELLKGIEFRSVFVSPLIRARESAEIALGEAAKHAVVVEAFREIGFGQWEGLTLDEAAERDPDNYREWSLGGMDFRFPGGDSKAGFFSRVAETAREVFADVELPAVAVVHKGVIKGILSGLLGEPVETIVATARMELGCVYVLEREAGVWRVAEANVAGHLGALRMKDSA